MSLCLGTTTAQSPRPWHQRGYGQAAPAPAAAITPAVFDDRVKRLAKLELQLRDNHRAITTMLAFGGVPANVILYYNVAAQKWAGYVQALYTAAVAAYPSRPAPATTFLPGFQFKNLPTGVAAATLLTLANVTSIDSPPAAGAFTAGSTGLAAATDVGLAALAGVVVIAGGAFALASAPLWITAGIVATGAAFAGVDVIRAFSGASATEFSAEKDLQDAENKAALIALAGVAYADALAAKHDAIAAWNATLGKVGQLLLDANTPTSPPSEPWGVGSWVLLIAGLAAVGFAGKWAYGKYLSPEARVTSRLRRGWRNVGRRQKQEAA